MRIINGLSFLANYATLMLEGMQFARATPCFH
jgi:hypothetical protein